VSGLAEDLCRVALLAPLDDEWIAWIGGRSEVRRLDAGAVVARQGDPADGLFIILAGRVEWTRDVGGREVHAVPLGAGEIFAELILILEQPYPTTGTALEPTTLLRLGPDAFWKLAASCPGVLREIVRVAVQRAEIHEGVSQQQARLVSLGTMAAGLAHELDNPAAAARRAARELPGAMAAARPADPAVQALLDAADRPGPPRSTRSTAGKPRRRSSWAWRRPGCPTPTRSRPTSSPRASTPRRSRASRRTPWRGSPPR